MRRGGLAQLTVSSFDLDGDDPAIVVKAGAKNKYKAERRVPLKAATVELLRKHLADKMPEALAFAVPPKQHSAKMIKADLDGAREVWLKESATPEIRSEREKTDFLRYCNSTGLYLDFHALRHTRGVWLFEHHKAHPREVQELMGVSSLALVDRYTQSFRLTDLSVIERGPDLSISPPADETKKTGAKRTAGTKTLLPGLSPDRTLGHTFVDSDGTTARQVQDAKSNPDRAETSETSRTLTTSGVLNKVSSSIWRGGRVVECAGFENRSARKGRGSSNLPLSVQNRHKLRFIRSCDAVLSASFSLPESPEISPDVPFCAKQNAKTLEAESPVFSGAFDAFGAGLGRFGSPHIAANSLSWSLCE